MRFLGIVFSALFSTGLICAQTAPAATTPRKLKEKLPLDGRIVVIFLK